MLQWKYMKKFLWSLLDKIVGDVKLEYNTFRYHNIKNTHTHISNVIIFFERWEGFHAQYRVNVLLWHKSGESKKAWLSSTCLLYALAALKMMRGNHKVKSRRGLGISLLSSDLGQRRTFPRQCAWNSPLRSQNILTSQTQLCFPYCGGGAFM